MIVLTRFLVFCIPPSAQTSGVLSFPARFLFRTNLTGRSDAGVYTTAETGVILRSFLNGRTADQSSVKSVSATVSSGIRKLNSNVSPPSARAENSSGVNSFQPMKYPAKVRPGDVSANRISDSVIIICFICPCVAPTMPSSPNERISCVSAIE